MNINQQETIIDYSSVILKTATFILETAPIHAILVTVNDLDKAKRIHSTHIMPEEMIIWATQNASVEEWFQDNQLKYVCFPHKHSNPLTLLAYYVISAVTQHFMAPDDLVLCITSKSDQGYLNQLYLFKPVDEFEIIQLINWHDIHPQFDPGAFPKYDI